MTDMIRDRWRTTLGTAICNRPRATLRWLTEGSLVFGRTSFRAETNGKASIGRRIEAFSVGATLSG